LSFAARCDASPTRTPTNVLRDPCPPKTAHDLEWQRLLGALAARCEGEPGRRLARKLTFYDTLEGIVRALHEVREAFDLASKDDPLPLADLVDLDGGVARARIGATLTNEELRQVRDVLSTARKLRKFLSAHGDAAPLLFEACATDPTLDKLGDLLASAFDPDGTLSDRASAKLGELRCERRQTRERLVRRLDELIRKHEGILQDTFWTERDGRYVLPVRADTHERFPGIVHATSASGSTIFIEPRAVVDMGNRQKMLDAEVVREEQAVYAALSARVAEHVHDVIAAAAALAHADVRAASARLARDLALTFPSVVDANHLSEAEPALDLPGARHPLLVIDGIDVVPSDLSLSFRRAMVVSGPNAGGKTVALKTMGLAALMVRAGLPVAAREGARVAAFDEVLTDVGDDQSLTKNLSTFSAHVRNLAGILDATGPGTLVLLDELAGGTDPREGEALAAAVLDSLCARGGAVACTTHYEGLKALALGDGRFDNASVGFDVATMTPTFHLAIGVPGASSALAVARRFGIPETVLSRAQHYMSVEAVSFEATVEKLAAERRALSLAREAAERETAALKQARRSVEQELARLSSKEQAFVTREGEALMQSIRRAREDLRAAQARLRGRRTDEQELRAVERSIDAVARKVAIGGDLEPRAQGEANSRPPVDPRSIRVGSRVYVPKLRADADVVDVFADGKLRVALGPLKLMTHTDEVRAADAKAPVVRTSKTRAAQGQAAFFDAAADPEVPLSTSDNTVDLRGLRAHEAISMAEQFLDRCLGSGRRVAFLVHGHGTGALRELLREELPRSKYVAKIRPAGPQEGGDGVTIVWLG
jgi:DNA mismatch repair protein MutS2